MDTKGGYTLPNIGLETAWIPRVGIRCPMMGLIPCFRVFAGFSEQFMCMAL